MIECIRTAARDSKKERIKVSCLDIIATMIGKKPYYEIKYKEIGEDYYHVGYSSYKLENVLAWKDECFEIVKECRPQTNADRIRSMTDEELSDAFMQCSNISMSKNDWIRWLQEESEEKHGTGGRTMGRLIDEGELIKVLEERATNEAICGYMTAYDVTNSIIDEVKEQPTAYDPDKVVEQLENEVKEYDKRIERRNGDCYFDETEKIKALEERARGIERAIEIVKGGGVDG
ncbi:MAG: hypothetical protein MRZ75_07075 [Roseburia sp.]|nr:hypothetical protein [Roseburia sp.]MDY5884245.1 hypothetical protein [Roseburia sp.]